MIKKLIQSELPTPAALLFSLLSGVLLTLGFDPFDYWYVIFIGCALFLSLLIQKKGKCSFWLGFSFGLGWFGAGISWVHVSIEQFGGLPLIGSLGLMLLLCAYLAIYPALLSWTVCRYFIPAKWPLVLPLLWCAMEWLRSWVFTGFPWLSLGYSQLNSPLTGWLPVIGETGVSGLVILLSATFAYGLVHQRWITTAVTCVSVLVSGLVLNQISWTQPTGETVKMAMVQGNIPQDLRWTPEQDAPTMQKYWDLTEPLWHENEVVIWPEAAVPQLEPIANDYLRQLDLQAAESQTGLITGIVNYNFETQQAFNTMLGLGVQNPDDAQAQYYYGHNNRFEKHHLLMIGEFIPFEDWLRGLAPIFDLPMSSFTRGDYLQANLLANGQYFSAALCFEIVFPRQVRANVYSHTDFLITLSNDAWFGNSHGPDQHMQIAQVRAKELGLPLVRSTNNGISGFVDHKGQMLSQLPQFEDGVLQQSMQKMSGTTPYRHFGDLLMWLIFIGFFVLAWWKLPNTAFR